MAIKQSVIVTGQRTCHAPVNARLNNTKPDENIAAEYETSPEW